VQVESRDTMPMYCWPPGGGNTLIEVKAKGLAIGGIYTSRGDWWQNYDVLYAMILNIAPDLIDSFLALNKQSFCAIYFDHRIPLKVLCSGSGVIELCDLSTNQRQWQISGPFASLAPLILPDKERLITVSDINEIQIRSLEDGRVLAAYSQDGKVQELKVTPDGHFLFFKLIREHDLARVARRLSNPLADWLVLKKWGLYKSDESVLLDLQTGTRWPQMADGPPRASFAITRSKSPKLIRVSAYGWCEWDIPPKWRWISPWAWYALILWLILVAAWRGLRRSQPANQMEPITKLTS
jgi:hypothetical protein